MNLGQVNRIAKSEEWYATKTTRDWYCPADRYVSVLKDRLNTRWFQAQNEIGFLFNVVASLSDSFQNGAINTCIYGDNDREYTAIRRPHGSCWASFCVVGVCEMSLASRLSSRWHLLHVGIWRRFKFLCPNCFLAFWCFRRTGFRAWILCWIQYAHILHLFIRPQSTRWRMTFSYLRLEIPHRLLRGRNVAL